MSYNRHSTYHYSLSVLYLLAVSLLCLEHKFHEDRRPVSACTTLAVPRAVGAQSKA